jgi:hypothetical protein
MDSMVGTGAGHTVSSSEFACAWADSYHCASTGIAERTWLIESICRCFKGGCDPFSLRFGYDLLDEVGTGLGFLDQALLSEIYRASFRSGGQSRSRNLNEDLAFS